MGGGVAVIAAAKVSAIGVFNGGIRGVPIMPPAEHSVRNATRPVSAFLSSSSASSKTPSTEVSSITAAWNDWEFTDSVEELAIEAGEPMPRVVFGGVPSFQEAKEATAELKDALDKVYLSSPKSTEFGDTFAADHVSVPSSLTNPELDSKSCVFFEATPTPVPNNVLPAFKLFSESPKAQTLVASIVSDPNVWNAMMNNTMLKEYMVSEQINDVPEPQSPKRFEESSDGGVDDVPEPQSPKRFEESSAGGVDDVPEPDGGPTGRKENNTGMMQNIKHKVLKMVSNVSNFFQNIFGVSASDDISSDSNGNTKTAGSDDIPSDSNGKTAGPDDIPFDTDGNTKTVGATIMGLVVMVIIVIVFKRV